VKKLLVCLVLLGAFTRLGFWINGGQNERYDNSETPRDIICTICDDAFTGIGDLCRSCVSVMEKVGKKWGYTR